MWSSLKSCVIANHYFLLHLSPPETTCANTKVWDAQCGELSEISAFMDAFIHHKLAIQLKSTQSIHTCTADRIPESRIIAKYTNCIIPLSNY